MEFDVHIRASFGDVSVTVGLSWRFQLLIFVHRQGL